MNEVKVVVSTFKKIVTVDGRKLALDVLNSNEINVFQHSGLVKEAFKRASEKYVGTKEDVGFVTDIDVSVTVISSSCVVIHYLINRFQYQHHHSPYKYSTIVFTKVRKGWVEQVNTCLEEDTSDLVIRLKDDLETEIRLKKDDLMWPVYFLYPEDCVAWLELRLLLHEQDGSAIGSLMSSREGPIKGHTKRIITGLRRALNYQEELLVSLCKLRLQIEFEKQ